jgi:hypothetical protein
MKRVFPKIFLTILRKNYHLNSSIPPYTYSILLSIYMFVSIFEFNPPAQVTRPRQGGPVVKVQSTKIEAERCGFDPSSVHQFLVRIGKEAGPLSNAKIEAVRCEFEPATSFGCSAMLRIGDRPSA